MSDKISHILNSSQDVSIEFDELGTYVNIWCKDENRLVKPKDFLIGKRMDEVLSPEQASYYLKMITNVLEQKTELKINYRINTLAGLTYFSGSIIPYSEAGDKATVLLLAKDITRTKERELILDYIEATAQIGGWEYIVESKEYNWSDQLYLMHEIPLNTPLKEGVSLQYYNEESVKRIYEAYEFSLSEKKPYNFEVEFIKGETKKILRITGTPILNNQDEVIKLTGTIQDITEFTNLTRAYEHQKKKLDRIVAQTPGVIYQFKCSEDYKFSFPFLSKSFTKMFGVDVKDIYTDPYRIIDRINSEDMKVFLKDGKKSMSDLTDFEWIGRVNAFNGNELWLHCKSTPKILKDKSYVWDGVIFDITKNKLKEIELENKQKAVNHQLKLASLGELSAGVAHEINNPLSIVSNVLSLFDDQVKGHKSDPKEMKVLLDYAIEATKRIENISKGLRVFSRGDVGVFESFDLLECTKTTVNLFSELYRSKAISIRLKYEGNNFDIYGNRGRVDQILMNLISNAKDSISNTGDGVINILLVEEDNHIKVEVTDNGQGISSEILDKIFDPFFTTKEVGKGTGLGLSLVHSIVLEHNGKIDVESSDKGTTFRILLPTKERETE